MSQGTLTTEQLAQRLHLRPQTIRLWRSTGVGPRFLRLNGKRGRCIYRLRDVEAWEEGRLFGSTTEESERAGRSQPLTNNE